MYLIREEQTSDHEGIRKVNLLAFESSAEADLVERLRTEADSFLSFVAETDGVVIGHILFTEVVIEERPDLQLLGLAPMSVLPSWQRKGVGKALIGHGLAACKARGFGAVVVLGHSAYYPRFGFEAASRFGLECEYDVPDEVFMALELTDGFLAGMKGTVRYHPAFREV